MRRYPRVPERRLVDFAVDMMLLQTFGLRALPDDIADRIFELADRESTFMQGVRTAKVRQRLAQTGVA